jgi:hypothetical protein
VFNRGVLRSMSRPGGVGAHAHVGDGHASVYGIEGTGYWRRERVVEKARRVSVLGVRARVLMRRGREDSILGECCEELGVWGNY